MTTLRDIVFVILEGKTLQDLSTTVNANIAFSARKRWEQLLATAPRKSPHEPLIEVEALASDQYYSAPPEFHVDTLLELIQLKLSAAEDHLRALQVDPAFFHERAKEDLQEAGSLDPFVDQGESITPLFCVAPGELKYRLTYGPFHNVLMWMWLLENCTRVKKQFEKYRNEIFPGRALPCNYEYALREFRSVLRISNRNIVNRLLTVILSTKHLRYL